MSYENNSYGNLKPRTYEEKLKAWPEGRKTGLFRNLKSLNNLPLELTLDFLEFDMEIELEK